MELSALEFERIQGWIHRNARPLDFARWRYHFEEGPREDVLKALAAYQNLDGGFGHALEPDSWNPASSPLQTSTAVALLDGIGFDDAGHPILQGILKYLHSGCDFADGRWRLTVPSNDLFAHAPWWSWGSDAPDRSDFNPTAILVGFLLRFDDCTSDAYAKTVDLARVLLDAFLDGEPLDFHPLACVISLLDAVAMAGLQDDLPHAKAAAAARRRADALIVRDPAQWTGYSCRPSWFVRASDSPFLPGNEAILEQELDYLLETRNAQGLWDISWTWGAYPREFAISEKWWKADLALRNLRLLRDFDRLVYRP